jgi:hypothetical protein
LDLKVKKIMHFLRFYGDLGYFCLFVDLNICPPRKASKIGRTYKTGSIVTDLTSPQEISDLFAVADRDLEDCRTSGLSADWQMNIAYNASLQLATVALAASGYRASRDAHHYRVIQSLAYTNGGQTEKWVNPSQQFATEFATTALG